MLGLAWVALAWLSLAWLTSIYPHSNNPGLSDAIAKMHGLLKGMYLKHDEVVSWNDGKASYR